MKDAGGSGLPSMWCKGDGVCRLLEDLLSGEAAIFQG